MIAIMKQEHALKTNYARLVDGLRIMRGTRIAVWDKDGVLGDNMQRHSILVEVKAKPPTKTWVDYSMAAGADKPIPGTVALMRQMRDHAHVVVTGTNEPARPVLAAWGKLHDVPWDGLIMRPDGDHSPNPLFKAKVVAAMIAAGLCVDIAFEDYPAAAEAIRATGVPVVVINPCFPPREIIPRGPDDP
jgi:beta-phosphoglucomutase-like phosphatase (HAD superfamily)